MEDTKTKDDLAKALENLEKTIRGLPEKNQKIFTRWLKTYSWYLQNEKHFDPRKNIKYEAGDIVTVEFGYNVDSEFGGRHPAVVIEDNPKGARSVMVVPLSSLDDEEEEKGDGKPKKTRETLKDYELYLGELKEFNRAAGKKEGTESFAVINQMRSISKMRIIRPTKGKHEVVHLEPDKLKLIYDKIKEFYTTYGLKRS
jgi:mRNA interferase MazF